MNWKAVILGGLAYYATAFIVAMWLWGACLMAAWSGVFNLPSKIWIWWGIDAAIYTIIGSIVLGIVVHKLAPAE